MVYFFNFGQKVYKRLLKVFEINFWKNHDFVNKFANKQKFWFSGLISQTEHTKTLKCCISYNVQYFGYILEHFCPKIVKNMLWVQRKKIWFH